MTEKQVELFSRIVKKISTGRVSEEQLQKCLDTLEGKRGFYVDTPKGKLKVWAKHYTDNPDDFPGVYVDLINNPEAEKDDWGELLACVEYDSTSKDIMSSLYYPESDEPIHIIHYR